MNWFSLRRFCLPAVGILALFQTSCVAKERFVRVAEKVLPKTVDIAVRGIAKIPIVTLSATEDGLLFEIKIATVPVTVYGSGVFISPNNHVLTCEHLFWPMTITSITVCRWNGECSSAELLYKEARVDLAVLRSSFTSPTPYAKIASPRDLRVGQEVIAVGSPLGFPFSVSHGIISALYRDKDDLYNVTQSDAFINPGNSGGPLFNLKGHIVGISRAMISPVDAPIFTGLGFSTQPGQIIELLARFRKIDAALPKWRE